MFNELNNMPHARPKHMWPASKCNVFNASVKLVIPEIKIQY